MIRQSSWERIALRRRILLLFLVIIPTIIASEFMAEILPYKGSNPLEIAIIILFGILFGWISIGLWTAIAGFLLLVGNKEKVKATRIESISIMAETKVAVLMPIYCEKVERICAGIEAIYRSIEENGKLSFFDFFILSDSDSPDNQIEEEIGWANLCRKVNGIGKIFYRVRRVRLKKKSGNIAEFCRRWAAYYKYLIVLDADSLMGGHTMIRLVEIMESNPSVGLVQTVPKAVGASSLFSRIEQFSSHLLGSMFAAGIHYWQLGDGQYWGHNAIIRTEPFIKYCGLPKLSDRLPFGGEILSHDFVESALLRKSGYSVWLAYELEDSYEELPPTLLDELKRDRRWCQGNLQHLRLIFSKGLFIFNRFLFLNGVMAYGSAVLWGGFLVLTTLESLLHIFIVPNYFPQGLSLFPSWPVFHADWAALLFLFTLLVLLMPKLLGVLLVIWARELEKYGGLKNLLESVFLEILFSTLIAPIKALFHGLFILSAFLGKRVSWGKQIREGAEFSWKDGLYHFFPVTIIGMALGISTYLLNPSSFWWLLPVIFSFLLSIPLAVLSSKISLGKKAKEKGIFMVPVESDPTPVIVALRKALDEKASYVRRGLSIYGFRSAVVDPLIHALHLACVGLSKCKKESMEIKEWKQQLIERSLQNGPESLSSFEKKALLRDPYSLSLLHKKIWTADPPIWKLWVGDSER
ncbi:glucans biosynthesis glucosyltransferase MdoH [Candidatus Methylacidiphilum fumarolicum]|uniref:Glucans biosynthesis glucosyltransferase H n=2 Tax=Candidatus Methylacidiphilum fumarolicum TaxID=591154 RepID=I0JZP2_METFB|nr:glucans biosynthesis glucosyltransferase MdoH [Candidatus Methylacidiphilum fumarolicum]MBW6414603.1 glucans biosynthesis glucosyltransferase MdoH [Candidatus Methylacidiphilum fumarolicum]TFE70885.1 glucan biosynthesis glucosyltransferase H [Candidatus Methylacidiphilum fumarolicum]TFE71854.1 glucans biosynthesis glucosyltransferase MdoH [Candidatus Methylacidiphilum fumarolicum]TFE75148.1 glucans biosynthesis glucosyltransferase MdoH [Candidatus Methylacidiphilum fumarolicum]TFE77394.1 gl